MRAARVGVGVLIWHPGLLEVRAGDFGGSGMGWREGTSRAKDPDMESGRQSTTKGVGIPKCATIPQSWVDSAPTTAGVI